MILAAALGSALLAGCSSAPKETTAAATTAETTAEEKKEESKAEETKAEEKKEEAVRGNRRHCKGRRWKRTEGSSYHH